MIGWYFDVIIGYLIRILIRNLRMRRSLNWVVENGTVVSANCPVLAFGGPYVEILYTYNHEGGYFSGQQRKPFMLRSSAENHVLEFPPGSNIAVRVKPEEPEISVLCD
jgi:hypothetical protein